MGYWIITGNRDSLHLSLEDAAIGWHGAGHNSIILSLSPLIDEDLASLHQDFVSRIEKMPCSWTIHPHSAPDICIDGAGQGFLERIKKSPAKSIAMINHFDNLDGRHDALIGIGIAVPDSIFDKVNRIFELALTSPEKLEYSLTLDFYRLEGTTTPSYKDFYMGAPYFSEEFSLSIQPNTATKQKEPRIRNAS